MAYKLRLIHCAGYGGVKKYRVVNAETNEQEAIIEYNNVSKEYTISNCKLRDKVAEVKFFPALRDMWINKVDTKRVYYV